MPSCFRVKSASKGSRFGRYPSRKSAEADAADANETEKYALKDWEVEEVPQKSDEEVEAERKRKADLDAMQERKSLKKGDRYTHQGESYYVISTEPGRGVWISDNPNDSQGWFVRDEAASKSEGGLGDDPDLSADGMDEPPPTVEQVEMAIKTLRKAALKGVAS